MNNRSPAKLRASSFITIMVNAVIATIRNDIEDVKGHLLSWLKERNDVLHYQPSNNGWTALQILEHVMLTSHYLLMIIDKASDKAKKRAQERTITLDWENYQLVPEKLQEIGVHKSFSWIRPEHMEPKGNFSLPEIRDRITTQFSRCNNHLDALKNGEGRLCQTTMTVNDIGKLDVYQYIYFLVLHAKRHLKQLHDNKAEFNLVNK